jgi:hypothetical protein
MEEAAEPLDT